MVNTHPPAPRRQVRRHNAISPELRQGLHPRCLFPKDPSDSPPLKRHNAVVMSTEDPKDLSKDPSKDQM